MTPSLRFARLALSAAALAGLARAQIPDGYLIAPAMGCSNGCRALGGLNLIHPITGTVTPVTGALPADLTGQGHGIAFGGNAVLYWPERDAVVVGGVVPTVSGLQAQVHVVFLQNGAYDATRSFAIPLGTPGTSPFLGGGVGGQMAWLSKTTVAVSIAYLASGPAAAYDVAFVDLAAQAVTGGFWVTPQPYGLNGLIEALAVDLASGTFFLAITNTQLGGATVVSTDASGVVTATLLTLPGGAADLGGIGALAYDADRDELVAPGGIPAMLRFLDPRRPGVLKHPSIPLPAGGGHAMAIERASGDYIVATGAGSIVTMPFTLHRVQRSGTVTQFTPAWYVTGLDLDPDPEAYGEPTPLGNTVPHQWYGLGGLPTVGNRAFELRVRHAAGGTPHHGIWFASADRGSLLLPLLSGQGHVYLGTPLVAGTWLTLLPLTNELGLSLPIPNDPALRGGRLCVQSIHSVPPFGWIFLSDAIEVTVL